MEKLIITLTLLLSINNKAAAADSLDRVSKKESKLAPYSSIASFLDTRDCTAFYIAKDIMLTAASCEYNYRKGQQMSRHGVGFSPGLNKTLVNYKNRVESEDIYTHEGYAYTGLAKYDLAVIMLEESDSNHDYLNISELTEDSYSNTIIAGYPDRGSGTRMFKNSCEINIDDVEDGLFSYTCETEQGMGGAPLVVKNSRGDYEVVGMHVASRREDGVKINYAIKFDKQIIDHIESVKKLHKKLWR